MEVRIPLLPGISHTDNKGHTVVDFLQRPQLLSSFRWLTSATRSQNLYQLADGTRSGMLIPTHMLNRGMVRNKVDGFTSFKATAVIQLLVNTQPFQCGRLLMAAAPVPSLLGNRKNFCFSHVSNTQNLQHVQMDVAKDTSVTLRVPFISPYNCFDLIDGKFDWGELQILVYSPLNSVSGDCCECNVYAHFEDIQMGAPTSGNVMVQQSASPEAVDRVRKKESTGRLTGALAKIGNSLVSKSLTAVSPLLSAGDAILAAAGWSKPILSKPSQVVLNRPEEGFAYMDGVDQSLVLAMTASNSIEPIPHLVGTGIDETDFHRLKRIPQMIAAFPYTNNVTGIAACNYPTTGQLGNPVPQLLWSCAVAPTCNIPACYNLTPPTGGTPPTNPGAVNPYPLTWKQPTTLHYISSPFLYWTGSLVYTFKVVKTDYHSGRLEVSFHPFINTLAPGNPPDTNWLANRMDYVYRTVIDIRKNSEVSVTVPYISAQPWKRISTFFDPINSNPPAPGRAKDLCTGILAVRALTPLFCTQTVSPNIEVLVEMRAGDDYEVQGPVTSKFLPFSFGNVDWNVAPTADIVEQSCSLDIVEQGVADFKVPSSIGRIWAFWANGNTKRAVLRGLANYPLVHININGDLVRAGAGAIANIRLFQITPKWEDVPPPIPTTVDQFEEYSIFFASWSENYSYEHDIIIPNPQGNDTLYVFLTQMNPAPAVAPAFLHAVDISAYGRPLNETININPNQLPLPITGGGTGGVVTIDPASLPLDVKVSQPEGPLLVNIENQPIEVTISETQLPLPTANQGSGGEQLVRIASDQFPLSVLTQDPVQVEVVPAQVPFPVQTQIPVQVQLLQEQFPLQVVQSQDPLPVILDSSQIPLPTTGGGGGGGGTVSIDPDQLPLWVSDYNVAPKDPRNPTLVSRKRARLEETDIVQQSGGEDKVATAGITETRTSAMEGWMPPCISGNERDAHRPSTAQYCAGERFTSFRQYSRRFAFCLVSGLDSRQMFKIQPVELVRPGILTQRITPGVQPGNDRTQYALYAPNTNAEVSGSPLNFVAGMYAFYRGSTRFKIWMDPRENPPNLISGHLEYSRQIVDANIIDDNIENFMTPIMYETPLQKQIAEFQVPYYSPTIVSSTWSHGIDSQFDTPLCNLIVSIPDFRQNTQNFPIKVAVAAGDDMDFHQFIGPPPVINVGDLLVTGRQLHYPPTGFTPTQKVPLDTARTDEGATRFNRVLYDWMVVNGNPSGASCTPPTRTHRAVIPDVVRVPRQIPKGDGVDEVDKLNPRGCPPPDPGLTYDAYKQYYENCQPSKYIID